PLAGSHTGQSGDRIEGDLQEVRLVRVREGTPGERTRALPVLKQLRMRVRHTTTRRGSPAAPLADPEPRAVPALRNRDQFPAFTRPGDSLAAVRQRPGPVELLRTSEQDICGSMPASPRREHARVPHLTQRHEAELRYPVASSRARLG